MSPPTNKRKTEKTRAIGPASQKNKKTVGKKPKKRASARPGKKVPITLHVFRELEFIRDLPDATFVIDRNGVVLAWNRAMEDLTGFSTGEILGKGDFCYAIPFYGERRPILIDLALNPDTCLPEIYDNFCRENQGVTATTRHARPKGENVILWVRASPITAQNGTTIGAVETIRDITRQQQMEDQLRASEERFRALTENTTDIIRIFDREGRIVFDTADSGRLLGYPAGFTLGKDPLEFIHPDDMERVKREFSSVYEKTNTGVPTEFRIRKADGSYIWVESVGKNLSDVPGVDGVVITTRFIEERKRDAENLRIANEKYTKAFLLAPDAITISELESGRFVEVNEAATRIFGYSRDELIGKNSLELGIWPEKKTRDAMVDKIRTLEKIVQYEVVERRKSGELFQASVTADTMNIGDARYLIATTRDITRQKNAENAIRESEDKYRALVNFGLDAVAVFDGTGKTLFVNKATTRLIGTDDVMALLGKNVLEFIAPESRAEVIKGFEQVMQGNDAYLATFKVRTINGNERWVESIGKRITFEGQNADIVSLRDITDRKKTEDELRESEARYSSLFTNSYSVSILIDPDTGIIVDANDAASQYYGYSKEQLTAFGIFDLNRLPKEKVVRDLVHAKDQKAKHFFSTHYLANGERRNVEIFSGPITVQGKTLFYSIIHDITERKRVEESLKESEARYSSLFTNSYSVSILIDPDTGMIVDANDAASQYYGYSKEQLTAFGIFNLNRLPKEKVVRDLVHAKDEKAKHFFSTHYLANGERRNVEIFSGPITVQGKTLFYSIIHDITDRVLAEQALRDSEAQMNMIIQGSPIPKFVIDTRHRLISWNKALEEATGIKAQDVLGTSMHWKAFYESERPCLVDLIVDGALDKIPQLYEGKYRKSDVAEEGYEATDFFPHLGKKGKWLRYVAAPIRNYQQKIIGAIETLEDITGLMEAQHSLRESEKRYRTLIDQLPDFVIVHRNGILLYVNPPAAEHLGYERQNMIGKSISLFIAPEYHDMAKMAVIKRMAGEEVPPYEMTITDQSGRSHAILVNGTQIQYEGEPASLNVLTDVTVIKEAEEVIRRANEDLERRVAERTESLTRTNIQLEQEIKARTTAEQEIQRSLEEKDLLLREIHHRVKNNLQIIASMLNLQSRTIKDENVLSAIRDSQSRVRAMALVHERIYRSHNIGEIDLRDYLQYMVQQLFMFHNIPHAKITLTFTMDPITTDIDTIVPIGLIINEMVSNSLKHAFPGERKGSIIIEGSNPSPDLLRFAYRDDGVGIPDDVDWKKPTSLGLRLISSLVEQCSGEITMERDGGTVFAFTMHTKKPVKMPGAKPKPE
jgi:PAS domain S-box-containing protein